MASPIKRWKGVNETMATVKSAWVNWLKEYGADKFYELFVKIAQNAQSTCVYCHEPIYLDIVEGSGGPDWKLDDGDYGCNDSPETCEEGVGSHKAEGTV